MRRILVACLLIFSSVIAKYDFEIWQDNTVVFDLAKQWRLVLSSELRYEGMARYLAEHYYETVVQYQAIDWLSIAPQYRQTFVRGGPGQPYNPVYSPMLNVTFMTVFQGWDLSDRNRAQLNINKWGDTTWVYRNRVNITLPVRWTKIKIRPYIADEFFFTEGRGFSQNRIYVGMAANFNPVVLLKLYGIYRNVKNSVHQWNTVGVLGIDFTLNF